MLKLRVHHLLCLKHFEGNGYSDAFVKHMSDIQRRIQTEPFQIVWGCDDICSCCQHRIGFHCDSVLAGRFDQRIATRHSFCCQYDSIHALKPVIECLDAQLVSICHECQWAYICMKSQSH